MPSVIERPNEPLYPIEQLSPRARAVLAEYEKVFGKGWVVEYQGKVMFATHGAFLGLGDSVKHADPASHREK